MNSNKKYKIAIDLLRLHNLETGLGQVMLNYAKTLAKVDHPEMEFHFLVPKNFVGHFGTQVRYFTPNFLRRYFSFLNDGFDLWHTTHQEGAFFPSKNTPAVMTIHDLNFLYEKTPAKIARRLSFLQRNINRATQIIAISNTTKIDVERHFDLGQKIIRVIYNGVHVDEYPHAQRPSFVPKDDFLLAISVFKPNKNFEVLPLMMNRIPDETLIIAGFNQTEYGQRILAQCQDLGLKNVVCPGTVTDEERYWLLSHCKALVFPSKQEGMGLPAIEAMLFGKPVFVSNLSSLPEFCGDMAYYFENFEPEKMVETLQNGFADFSKHPEKSEQIKDYAKTFSMEQYVQKHIDLFETILSRNSDTQINAVR